jgi:hypothetical protein
MKINPPFVQIITVCILLFASCQKSVDIPLTACVAGNSGKVTLTLKPEHHGVAIISTASYPDSAFIKFNAEEFPGDDPDAYDLIVTGNNGDNFVTINNLNCGRYYVFMTGFDQNSSERVKGGIPVVIAQREGNLTLKIPVTED